MASGKLEKAKIMEKTFPIFSRVVLLTLPHVAKYRKHSPTNHWPVFRSADLPTNHSPAIRSHDSAGQCLHVNFHMVDQNFITQVNFIPRELIKILLGRSFYLN